MAVVMRSGLRYRLPMQCCKTASLGSRTLRLLWLACLLSLGAVAPAAAAPKAPTVAVMPFRDLAGGSRYLGEAIRETVTSDLKQLGSLRVVERGNLDKVLAEQGLQSGQKELEVTAVVKLGKVLGASLILVGAYQKLAPQVRLTARFIKVETSEVIGTAKVDGSTRELLRLQDRITAALLRSAGLAIHAKQVLDESEHRPDLASLKTMELYGQSVLALSDDERRQFLTLAVAEDKNFSYAVKDLEALEQRIKGYQSAAASIQEKQLHALQEKLRTTTDVMELQRLVKEEVELLEKLHRFRTLIREARNYLDGLGPGAAITFNVDMIAQKLIQWEYLLKDYDAVLRDGERYMQRAPGSTMFANIKHWVESAIRDKREIADGKSKAEADVAAMASEQRWDLCAVSQHYFRHRQAAAARRLLNACVQVGTKPRAQVLSELAAIEAADGQWTALRQVLDEWERSDPGPARAARKGHEFYLPSDD